MARHPTEIFQGYVFDLDGTVYLGEALLPGAKRTIETLRRVGCRIVFVSNKPVQPRKTYADKLPRLGLPTPVGQIVNSTQVTVRELLKRAPGCRVFPIGEQVLIEALQGAGNQPGDTVVKVSNLMGYLSKAVPESARRICRKEQ